MQSDVFQSLFVMDLESLYRLVISLPEWQQVPSNIQRRVTDLYLFGVSHRNQLQAALGHLAIQMHIQNESVESEASSAMVGNNPVSVGDVSVGMGGQQEQFAESFRELGANSFGGTPGGLVGSVEPNAEAVAAGSADYMDRILFHPNAGGVFKDVDSWQTKNPTSSEMSSRTSDDVCDDLPVTPGREKDFSDLVSGGDPFSSLVEESLPSVDGDPDAATGSPGGDVWVMSNPPYGGLLERYYGPDTSMKGNGMLLVMNVQNYILVLV